MAFNSGSLSAIVQPVGGIGLRFFSYKTDDTSADVTSDDYFADVARFGVRFGDLLFVGPQDGSAESYVTVVQSVDDDGDATVVFSTVPTFNVGVPADRTALAATDTSLGSVYLSEQWREGWFKWDNSNLSAAVTADPRQGIYVPPAGTPSGASGAWVRIYEGALKAQWFGAYPVALSVASSSAPDRLTEVQAAMDYASSLGGGIVELPPGKIANSAKWFIPDHIWLKGVGREASIVLATAGNITVPINNKNYGVIADLTLGAPGIRLSDFTIDCSLRPSPKYLSNAAGTPITDPKADYRVGGCLAPTTFATISLTVTGGVVTGATITNPGSGYTNPAVVWVYGDGKDARVVVTLSGGVVSTVIIREGGSGYTSATAEVGGGGAPPVPTLYDANRRNINYGDHPSGAGRLPAITLYKTTSSVIERMGFISVHANTIVNAGSDHLVVRDCYFDDCGDGDGAAMCMWSERHGTTGRQSTNTVFEYNTIRNNNRSVAMMGGIGEHYRYNDIDGWGEACFFATGLQRGCQVYGNVAKRGRITDIVCDFCEISGDMAVYNNTVSDVDGKCISVALFGGARVYDNWFLAIADANRSYTLPFSPFSERTSPNFAVGGTPIAGTNRNSDVTRACLCINCDNIAGNSPQATFISRNKALTLYDKMNQTAGDYNTRVAIGKFDNFLTFGEVTFNTIGDVLLAENDLSVSPGTYLYNRTTAAMCLDPNAQFIIQNNLGVNEPVPVPSYFASSSSVPDGGSYGGDTVTVVPPVGTQVGDLIVVICHARVSRTPTLTWANTVTGGQTWTIANPFDGAGPRSSMFFWCRFNGTWAANPVFQCPTNVAAATGIMHVFRPDVTTRNWSIDVPMYSTTFSTPTGPPYIIPCAGSVTTAHYGTVTMATWFIGNEYTWTNLTGSGWIVAGSAQYINISGTGNSTASAYHLDTLLGTTVPAVSYQESGNASGSTAIVSWHAS